MTLHANILFLTTNRSDLVSDMVEKKVPFSGSLVFLVLAAMAASRSVTGIAGGAAGGAVRRWKEAEDGMNDEHCISVSL